MTQVLTLCEGAPSCFNKILSMKVAVMKIVWRNPNHINSTSCLIEKTSSVERGSKLRVFYHSSRGPGALGTLFELLVNRTPLLVLLSRIAHGFFMEWNEL